MASAQEVEMLRRQLDELTAQSSSTAMSAAVSGLAEAVRTMGQSVSKPRPEDMRVGKPEPYVLGEDFDDWDFTFNGYAGTLDPACPALLKTARQSPTVVMATPPHEQQSATLLYLHEQATSEMQFEEHALRLNAGDFANRTIPVGERTWTNVEPGSQSPIIQC